jgi:hypothetical protein
MILMDSLERLGWLHFLRKTIDKRLAEIGSYFALAFVAGGWWMSSRNVEMTGGKRWAFEFLWQMTIPISY